MNIHIYHHFDDKKLDEILAILKDIQRKEVQIMATLDEVLAGVTAETTEIDSLFTFVAGLKQQLADALAGVLTPEQQAKVDAIFAAVEANKQKIADAMAANVKPA